MLHKHLSSSVSNICIFKITTKSQNQLKKREVTILSINSITHLRLIGLCLVKFSIESRLIKFHESKSLIKPVKLTRNLKFKPYLQKYIRNHYSLSKTKISLMHLGFLHLLSQFTIILKTQRFYVVGEILEIIENGTEKSGEEMDFVGV